MVSNHSTLAWDLYSVYAGKDGNGEPVIKVFLNPLVAWIWIGVLLVIAGTAIALAPNRMTMPAIEAKRLRADGTLAPAEGGD
jgi:cytochrome c-type biogenesis protein CcmF